MTTDIKVRYGKLTGPMAPDDKVFYLVGDTYTYNKFTKSIDDLDWVYAPAEKINPPSGRQVGVWWTASSRVAKNSKDFELTEEAREAAKVKQVTVVDHKVQKMQSNSWTYPELKELCDAYANGTLGEFRTKYNRSRRAVSNAIYYLRILMRGKPYPEFLNNNHVPLPAYFVNLEREPNALAIITKNLSIEPGKSNEMVAHNTASQEANNPRRNMIKSNEGTFEELQSVNLRGRQDRVNTWSIEELKSLWNTFRHPDVYNKHTQLARDIRDNWCQAHNRTLGASLTAISLLRMLHNDGNGPLGFDKFVATERLSMAGKAFAQLTSSRAAWDSVFAEPFIEPIANIPAIAPTPLQSSTMHLNKDLDVALELSRMLKVSMEQNVMLTRMIFEELSNKELNSREA